MSVERIADRTNIRVTVEGNKVAEQLKETGCFEDELAIAKFALAYAIKNRFDENLDDFKLGADSLNKWNIGSVDGDSYLRDLIKSLHPETETPYRYVEALINKGLQAIGAIIDSEGLSKISKFM